MMTIVVLDENGIHKIKVCAKTYRTIQKKYDGDIETWMYEKGIEEEMGINMGCAYYQVFEDEPETTERKY